MDQRAIEFILRITSEGLLMIVVVCGPPILLSMIVGLSVSLFQAVTQIQEATLTFVPKMLIIFATLAVALHRHVFYRVSEAPILSSARTRPFPWNQPTHSYVSQAHSSSRWSLCRS